MKWYMLGTLGLLYLGLSVGSWGPMVLRWL